MGVLGEFPLTRGIVKHNAFLAERVTSSLIARDVTFTKKREENLGSK